MLTRTPLTRKTPMRRGSIERKAPAAGPKPPKAPRCKAPGCKNPAIQYRKHCSDPCGLVLGLSAIEKAKRLAEKQAREAKKLDAANDRARAEAMKSMPDLLKEVKAAMHEWVRLRDRKAGYGCICCGRPLRWDVPGGAVDAGHYRSVGSAAHLRFDERNIHAQLARPCNKDQGGNPHGYRLGLIERIGLQAVLDLESDQAPRNYTKDDLRALRAKYRALAAALRKELR